MAVGRSDTVVSPAAGMARDMSESTANASTATGSPTLSTLLDEVLKASMMKDKGAVLAAFAPDAIFIDPHYPTPEMRGLDEIGAGLDWAFMGMKRFGFTVIGSFMSDDGFSGAIEMNCEHELANGRMLSFPQVFVAEMKDGLLTRLRAYEPYGPGGLVMLVLKLQNWWLHHRPGRTVQERHRRSR